MIPSVQHKDYLPDVTRTETENDYEPEEEEQHGAGEEEYDEYPEREND